MIGTASFHSSSTVVMMPEKVRYHSLTTTRIRRRARGRIPPTLGIPPSKHRERWNNSSSELLELVEKWGSQMQQLNTIQWHDCRSALDLKHHLLQNRYSKQLDQQWMQSSQSSIVDIEYCRPVRPAGEDNHFVHIGAGRESLETFVVHRRHWYYRYPNLLHKDLASIPPSPPVDGDCRPATWCSAAFRSYRVVESS